MLPHAVDEFLQHVGDNAVIFETYNVSKQTQFDNLL